MQISENVSLVQHTTLGIGGPAKYFMEVMSDKELKEALRFTKAKSLPFLIIGNGSNLLVADEGVNSIIIKNSIAGLSMQEDSLRAGSGTSLQELVDFSIEQGLSGMQKITGIPGTIGGAIYSNAGAYGQTISDYLFTTTCLNPDTLQIVVLNKDQCGFDYRESAFKESQLIIISAEFVLPKTDIDTLKAEAATTLKARQEKYKPGIKCPGSFFKNVLSKDVPEEKRLQINYQDTFGKIPAWYFLGEVGAKGQRRGDIEIADFHANLFMNIGNGTAKDFHSIASEYAQKVKEKFGIELEPEVQLINLPPIKYS